MWNKDAAERMYLQVVLQIHHSDELSQSHESTRGFHTRLSGTHVHMSSFWMGLCLKRMVIIKIFIYIYFFSSIHNFYVTLVTHIHTQTDTVENGTTPTVLAELIKPES